MVAFFGKSGFFSKREVLCGILVDSPASSELKTTYGSLIEFWSMGSSVDRVTMACGLAFQPRELSK